MNFFYVIQEMVRVRKQWWFHDKLKKFGKQLEVVIIQHPSSKNPRDKRAPKGLRGGSLPKGEPPKVEGYMRIEKLFLELVAASGNFSNQINFSKFQTGLESWGLEG